MRIVTSAFGSVVLFAIAMSMQASILNAADVVVTSDADTGVGTLREAVGTAVSGDVIVFDIPAAAPVITLATPLPQLTGDISFRNDGTANVVLDRNGTTAWEFIGGTIDPTELIIVNGGAPSADADIVTNAETTITGNAILTGNLSAPGTISPGALAASGSIGTLEITGDLDATEATIPIDIDSTGATQTDLISVGGTVTLNDATVNPTFAGQAFSPGQNFTIIEAGSIVGAFANAGDVYALPNQPFLEAVQDVALPVTQFGFFVQDNGASFDSVVTGCNQTSAAGLLDELQALGTVAAVTTLREGTGETVAMAVDQLSGSIYPSLINAEINHIQNNLASVRDRVSSQGTYVDSIQKVAWARGYGASAQVDRDACETVGYQHVIGGVELGAGLRTNVGLAIYAFGHLADSTVETRGVDQTADVSSYRVGGIIEYRGANSYVIAAGGSGTQDYEVRRSLDAFDGSTFAESSFEGASKFAYIEFGNTWFQNEHTNYGPYVGLSAGRVDLDPVTETGDANFALNTPGGVGDSYRSIVGLSFTQSAMTNFGLATTRFRAGWMHEYGNQFEVFQSQLAAATPSLLIDQGVAAGRDWGFVRMQADMGVILGGQLTASYLGQYNTRSSINTGLLGLHWAF